MENVSEQQLHDLAVALGNSVGASAFAAWQGAMDDATPDEPLAVAEKNILRAVMPWGEWAARVPREKGDPAHNLLEAVKDYRRLLRLAEEEDE